MDTEKSFHQNFNLITKSEALIAVFENFCTKSDKTGFPYSADYGSDSHGVCAEEDEENTFDELCELLRESSVWEDEEYLLFHEKEEICDQGIFSEDSRIVMVWGQKGREKEALSAPFIRGVFNLKRDRTPSELLVDLWEKNHMHLPYLMFLLIHDWTQYGDEVESHVKEEIDTLDLSFLPEPLKRFVQIYDRFTFSPVKMKEAIEATKKITFYLSTDYSQKTATQLFLTILTYWVDPDVIYTQLLSSAKGLKLDDIPTMYSDSLLIGTGIFPQRGTHKFDQLVRMTANKIYPGGAPTKYEHADTAWIDLVGKVRTAFYKCAKGQ